MSRRGKFLILPLSRGDELIVHLGMTGVISTVPPSDHVRVELVLDGPNQCNLYFRDVRRFGRFLVVPAGEYGSLPTLAGMGPEPLSAEFTVAEFRHALSRSSVAVKTYLLSQKPVAGVGNIYADEALWRARIHPETPANEVSAVKAKALRDAIRQVLERSIAAQGTTLSDYRTVNGEPGSFLSQLSAYGQGGKPCSRCGRMMERSVVGARSTVYCPRCQRSPRVAGRGLVAAGR